MLLTNSSSQMILSITHRHTHMHTWQTHVMGSLEYRSCISHNIGANMDSYSHPQTHIIYRMGMAMYQWNRKAALYLTGWHQIAHLVSVCVDVYECVFSVCMFKCICVSSLIALTPGSVKWDCLPLSVFKSSWESRVAKINWWITKASSQMSLLALIETMLVSVD